MQNFIDWLMQVFTLFQPLWQMLTLFVCDCIPKIFMFIANHPLVALTILATSVGTYLKRQ